MMRTSLAVLALAVSAGAAPVLASAQPAPAGPAAASCKPSVEPVAITAQSQPYRRAGAPPAGYVEQEFSISCRTSAGPYRTVVHVRRPAATRASGMVIVEPWHPGDLWPVYGTTEAYLARSGHASVVVASSPRVISGLVRPRNPARYAHLTAPEGAEPEVLAQVGALLKRDGGKALLGAPVARRVILAGYSNTGAVVRRYIAEQHESSRLAGKPIFDGYFPGQTAVGSAPTAIPDLDVPVVEVQGESELIRTFERGADRVGYRREDGPLYRLYEVPGLSHIATREPTEGGPSRWTCVEQPRSNFIHRQVWAAALDSLVRWVDRNEPAPHAPRVETRDGGRTIVRDAQGNALGGVRTSYLDVPTATWHVTSTKAPGDPPDARCDMIGWREALPADVLKRLYPRHADYVRRVNGRLDELVRDRWLLAADAEPLRREAAAIAP